MPNDASTATAPLVQIAAQLGEHALGAFLLLLLVSTLIGGGVCWALQQRRARARSDEGEEPQPPRLLAGLVAGFVLILAAAVLFAFIAERIETGRTLGLADQALADAIGQYVHWHVLVAFSWITHLGDAQTVTVICTIVVLLLWRHAHRGLALGLVLALMGNVLLNPTLKRIFERARPVHDHGLAHETSFSFPSGHSSGAMVTYGMLLYVALRTLPPRWHVPATMGAIAATLTIACSRIFLQVHFASDVAAGLLSGLAWVTVCVLSLEYARHRKARRR